MINTKLNNISFGSKLNPISPFTINTDNGQLFVKEIDVSNITDKKSRELTKFFCDSFIDNTKDPFLLKFKNKNTLDYIGYLVTVFNYYTKIFNRDDGHTTLLEARDKNNKLCGAVLTNTFDEQPLHDEKICFLNALAVDENYRKKSVGKILMNKALESAQKAYDDVFVSAEALAEKFYTKNGYRHLEYDNLAEKYVIDEMNINNDYPTYTKYMTKKLNNNNKDCFVRLYNNKNR